MFLAAVRRLRPSGGLRRLHLPTGCEVRSDARHKGSQQLISEPPLISGSRRLEKTFTPSSSRSFGSSSAGGSHATGGLLERLKQNPLPLPPIATPSGAARVLDGRQIALEWVTELRGEVEAVTAAVGRPPRLRVVLVGQRADSCLYVHRKLERCHEIGVDAELLHLPETATQEELESAIRAANSDQCVDGVLVQLPLAAHMNEGTAMALLQPNKDVDGFHPLNMGALLMKGRNTRLVPCTALGCLELLRRSGVVVRGKQVVVVGDSNIVGAPLSIGLLREQGAAAVTVCNRSPQESLPHPAPSAAEQGACDLGQTESRGLGASTSPMATSDDSQRLYTDLGFPINLPEITRTADILVVAVGHPMLVRADWVKPGAVVIDVGINVVDSAEEANAHSLPHRTKRSQEARPGLHVVGDVAFDEVSHVASALTPVPGGVGPMTIAAVVHNTIRSAKFVNGLPMSN